MQKFRIPYIPYRSLLLSTTVLNDIYSGLELGKVYLDIQVKWVTFSLGHAGR